MNSKLTHRLAHRVNLVRHLKGLTDIIDISVVKPYPKGDDKGWPGWQFPNDNDEYPSATVDKLFGSKYLHEVYFKDDKEYKGRYSVPLLWDTKTNSIVNNVSLLKTAIQLSHSDTAPHRKAPSYYEHFRYHSTTCSLPNSPR